MVTKLSVTAEYRAADGGETAVHMLRWVSTRGEYGLWIQVASATVAASGSLPIRADRWMKHIPCS